MADSTEIQTQSPFLALPRELRDMIYEMALEDVEVVIFLKPVVAPRILLASKQTYCEAVDAYYTSATFKFPSIGGACKWISNDSRRALIKRFGIGELRDLFYSKFGEDITQETADKHYADLLIERLKGMGVSMGAVETQCLLFGLPQELRDMIYQLTLPETETYIRLDAPRERPIPSNILLTCKQAHKEAMDLYYGFTRFDFPGFEQAVDWLSGQTVTITSTTRIKKVLIWIDRERIITEFIEGADEMDANLFYTTKLITEVAKRGVALKGVEVELQEWRHNGYNNWNSCRGMTSTQSVRSLMHYDLVRAKMGEANHEKHVALSKLQSALFE